MQRTPGLAMGGWVLIALCLRTELHAQPNAVERRITRSNLVLLQPLNEAAPSRNAGLFVGVNEFTVDSHINGLQFAVHDAIELAYLFVVELKLIPARNCHLLLSGQPSTAVVERHLAELQQQGCAMGHAQRSSILAAFLRVRDLGEQPSDLLVCTFSSHGFGEGRQAFIMPSDGSRELLSETAIPLDSIETRMEASKAGHRLLLVDACQERLAARNASGSGVGTPMSALFLDALSKPTGQAKLASCSPGEFSYENDKLGGVGHGIFTWAFLEALRGGAQPDEQNLVRLGTVADYVSVHVTDWAKQAGRTPQTPFYAGPQSPRTLPLAVKSGNLEALIAVIEKHATSAEFTESLRGQLAAILRTLDMAQQADRQLAAQTREFAAGRLPEGVFVPYLERELTRRPGQTPRPLVAPFTASAAQQAQRDWAKHMKTSDKLQNSIGMKLALIPAGEFQMGSPENEPRSLVDEQLHRVRITRPFFLGIYEVTQAEYERVMGMNPSQFSEGGDTSRYPVESIGWEDAVEFCRKLSLLAGERRLGRTYRLPTEAEWEYACRAGMTTPFHFGTQLTGRDANFNGNFPYGTGSRGPYLKQPLSVGSYAANGFGLYDMHGNVSEWCQDGFDEAYYQNSPVDDPQRQETFDRVYRGGSWSDHAEDCRAARRGSDSPFSRYNNLGFRVALIPPAE